METITSERKNSQLHGELGLLKADDQSNTDAELSSDNTLGLEISINGKKLCTAGIEKGSLSATVATVGKAPAAADNSQAALLTVSGFIETAKTYSHPWWVPSEAIPHLNAGDTVTIRVVNVDPGEVDRPGQTHRKLKQKPAQGKRKDAKKK